MLFSGLRKQSDTAYGLFFMLIASSDHISGLTGKSGSVVVSLSKNGAGGGSPAGSISEIDATNFPGLYKIAGNATDSNTLGPLFIHAKDSASDPYDSKYDIVDYNPFAFKPPVTLAPADVSGNLPAQVKAEDNLDFGALKKASLNAATPASVQNIPATGSGFTALGDTRLANLDAAITTRSGHSAADVWAVGTRTLTSFGTLVADIATAVWGYVTRILTAGTNIVLAKDTGLTGLNDLSGADVRTAVGLASANLDTQLAAISSPTAAAVADQVWNEAIADHIAAGSTGAKLNTVSVTLGSGAIAWIYTLTNSVDGIPLADADVWITTDLAGLNVIASGRTDAYGVVTFNLDAGTVYVWRQKTGWNFSNPDMEVVS